MFTHIFIPFLLMTNTYVEKEPHIFPTVYEFNFDYDMRLKELASSIQFTGKLICHSPMHYITVLRCFLQDVKCKQPNIDIRENSIFTIVYIEKDFKFSEPFWFDIIFNNTIGAQSIHIKDKYWNLVEADIQIKEKVIDLIIGLTYLFKIDINKINKTLNMESTSGSSVFTSADELSIVGTCETKYNMTVKFNKTNDDPSFKFQIIPTFLTKYFTEKKDTLIQIEKYVKVEDKKYRKCDNKRLRETFRGMYIKDDFIDDIEIVNNTYKMEIVNDKLYISNIINVRQTLDQLDSRTFAMYQKTSLNLIEMKYSSVYCDQPYYDYNHEWIEFSI